MRSVDHVKAVAHVDARPLVGQAHLLEEVGHALREVLVLALGTLQVAHLGRLVYMKCTCVSSVLSSTPPRK